MSTETKRAEELVRIAHGGQCDCKAGVTGEACDFLKRALLAAISAIEIERQRLAQDVKAGMERLDIAQRVAARSQARASSLEKSLESIGVDIENTVALIRSQAELLQRTHQFVKSLLAVRGVS